MTFGAVTLKPGKRFRRSVIAALSAAVIGLAFVSTAASARPGGGFRGGGFHGGFHGFRGGFHGGHFRPGFRAFGPAIGFGLGLGYPYYAGYYGYGYDDCLVPRRVWTPYGWRVRLVNVCGYY